MLVEPVQSALDPAGSGAEAILTLFWIFLGVSAVVWVLVVIALALAAARRRSRAERGAGPLAPAPRGEARARGVVGSAVAATGAVLITLTAFSYFTGKSLADAKADPTLTIEVTGHQWWWELRYDDPRPDMRFTTANEIHVPVGERVRLILTSNDVIHSFWVPSLAGKQDLIPGHDNEIVIEVAREGTYRGSCAEFCGLQHAHMGLTVIAEPRAAFDRWRAAQAAPAAPPQTEEAARGLAAFQQNACVLCHAIRGTGAGGMVAPDLTHVASRSTLAAGTLPFTRGALGAWIADPQAVKPGANMPRSELDPDELNAIIAYLEGLT